MEKIYTSIVWYFLYLADFIEHDDFFEKFLAMVIRDWNEQIRIEWVSEIKSELIYQHSYYFSW